MEEISNEGRWGFPFWERKNAFISSYFSLFDFLKFEMSDPRPPGPSSGIRTLFWSRNALTFTLAPFIINWISSRVGIKGPLRGTARQSDQCLQKLDPSFWWLQGKCGLCKIQRWRRQTDIWGADMASSYCTLLMAWGFREPFFLDWQGSVIVGSFVSLS